jgi:hypothetical protein
MTRARTFAIATLLLVWCAAPAIACLVPQTLTPEESRCCKQMAGACHQTSAKHSCCRQVQPQDAASAEARRSAVLFIATPVTPTVVHELPAMAVERPAVFLSPPHSPPPLTSILRI